MYLPFFFQKVENFQKIYEDETYTDLLFKIDKTTQIKAHSVVVSKRCPALLNPKGAKKKPKVKKGFLIVEVTSFPVQQSLKFVLQYVYTGNIEFSRLNASQLILTLMAAMELGIERLIWLCKNYFKQSLVMNNVFEYLKAANQYKEEFCKLCCLNCCIKNYEAFIANKDGGKVLGLELFQEVVAFHSNPRPTPEIEQEPNNSMLSDFKAIFDEMPSPDVVVRVRDSFIPCHKAFLASQSEALAKLCAAPTPLKSKEFKDVKDSILLPPIQVQGKKPGPVLSPEAFSSMLKYFYYGEKNIPSTCACELLLFSKDLKIPNLHILCEEVMKRNINAETALNILEVTYMPQMSDREPHIKRELQDNSIEFILNNIKVVDLSSTKDMDPLVALDILFARQRQEMGEPIRRKMTLELVPEAKQSSSNIKESTELPVNLAQTNVSTPVSLPPPLQTPPPKLDTKPPKLETPLNVPPKLETPPLKSPPKLETPSLNVPPKLDLPPTNKTSKQEDQTPPEPPAFTD